MDESYKNILKERYYKLCSFYVIEYLEFIHVICHVFKSAPIIMKGNPHMLAAAGPGRRYSTDVGLLQTVFHHRLITDSGHAYDPLKDSGLPCPSQCSMYEEKAHSLFILLEW